MSKNSTLKLLEKLIEERPSSKNPTLSKEDIGPKRETIEMILAYASSVEALEVNSIEDKVLISLN